MQRTITPEIRLSLSTILEYLWRDEERDWEASERPQRHIFRDLQRVAAWLETEPDRNA